MRPMVLTMKIAKYEPFAAICQEANVRGNPEMVNQTQAPRPNSELSLTVVPKMATRTQKKIHTLYHLATFIVTGCSIF